MAALRKKQWIYCILLTADLIWTTVTKLYSEYPFIDLHYFLWWL